MRLSRFIALLLVATASPYVRSAIAAGDAKATGSEVLADSGGLEEIVVTASKRREAANDVPMSIVALSGQQLDKLDIKDVSDLTRVVPGFQEANSGYNQPIYFLRGVGYFDTALSSKPTVTVYSDEIPLPLSVMTLGAPFDVQQVEVLKGPQGTLFGENATGGAINFIAAKPTDTVKAGFDLSYGRFNNTDVSGFLSGPISNELSIRLALRHDYADPWQNSYTGSGKNGATDFSQGRLVVDFHPSSRLNVTLNLNGFLDRGQTQAPQFEQAFTQTKGSTIVPGFLTFPAAPNNPRAADWSADIPLRKNDDFKQASLRADYKLTDDVTLTSLSSYDRFTEEYGLEQDGTPYDVFATLVSGHVNAATQELRTSGTIANRAHWVTGLNFEYNSDFENQEANGSQGSSANAFAKLGLPPIQIDPEPARNIFRSSAAFANMDYDLSREFVTHLGARYTKTSDHFSGCLISAGNGTLGYGLSRIFGLSPPVQPGECTTFNEDGTYAGLVKKTLDEHNISWRSGLDWKPNAQTLVYGNVSRGFKSGGFPNLGASSAAQYTPVQQEEVTAYEIGIKKGLLDQHLQFNAAIFDYNYENKQLKGRIVVPVFGALNAIINVPHSDVKGAEVQTTWKLGSHWTLNAGATYLHTEVNGDFFNYTYAGVLTNFNGARFPYAPTWQVNADGEYDWTLSDRLGAFLGASVTYRGATSSEFIPAPIMAIPSYTLLDARAGLQTTDGVWRLTLSGHNLTDKYYWTQMLRFGDAIVRYAGMPDTWSLALSYRY